MIAHASRKVKEGKVVKVEVEYDEIIKRIKITGDFFLHPEDVLEKIEKGLIGLKNDASLEIIISKIQEIVDANNAFLIGVSPQSLAFVIKEAMR